jgi:hypothetical protein
MLNDIINSVVMLSVAIFFVVLAVAFFIVMLVVVMLSVASSQGRHQAIK